MRRNVELPPLRARRGDIARLTRHFWKRLGGPGEPPYDELLRRFERMPWYGNVRELAGAVARCIALGEQSLQAEAAQTSDGDAMEEVASIFPTRALAIASLPNSRVAT